MQLLIEATGKMRCIYSDALDLHLLGRPTIKRASSVEPDDKGHWHADLGSVQGPVLGPCQRRAEALQAERRWLIEHWLTSSDEAGNMVQSG